MNDLKWGHDWFRFSGWAAAVLTVTLIAGCGGSSGPETAEADQGAATSSSDGSGSTEISSTSKADVDFLPSLKGRKYDAAIRDVVVKEDPVVDGWDSEEFSESAGKQLKIVGKMLTTGDLSHIEEVCNSKFTCSDLRPSALANVFKGPIFSVSRGKQDATLIETNQGRSGFEAALKQQAEILPANADSHFKFKIFRARLGSGVGLTLAYFQMSGAGEGNRRVQVNATWQCRWNLAGGGTPDLASVLVTEYEEIVTVPDTQVAFSDCTRAAFDGLSILDEQLIHGRDHWYSNLEATIGVEGRGNGIAIGDANGDGLEDIYFCQPAALPNRLFVRQPDGSMLDKSAEAGVDWLDSSRGALFVDLDNDGDQDLVLAQSTDVLIHENDGSGVFKVRETLSTNSKLFSINALDYDGDGRLDLYVCGYTSAEQDRPEDIFASPVPYHDANNGGPSLLWRSEGDWKYEDKTEESGLNANNLRFSLASVWEDYDNDGDLDLYVANDFGRNSLYRNDDGKFTDVAGDAGVEDIGPGMSAAWGDANNDGLMDLYVSNMFSSAGSRITH
ncbi:MAG: VCBS repeat-containing protein, partial [Planctomycetota bacterium]